MCKMVRSTKHYSPNHFLEVLPESITSSTPARKGSIDGTWLARIPISPVSAAIFTCTTSVEVKMASKRC
jgi:hypothetical protein